MNASGYSFACSISRTRGRTSRSTNARTTSTTACSSVSNALMSASPWVSEDGDAVEGVSRGDELVELEVALAVELQLGGDVGGGRARAEQGALEPLLVEH